ncbi:MAG: choice-of-anchor I domain-containing protein [Phycisphaerales bacterium JB047]
MKYSALTSLFLLCGMASIAGASGDTYTLRQVSTTQVEGGVEIIVFDESSRQLHAIGASGRMVFGIDDGGIPALQATHLFSETQAWETTSIAIDPLGRGFGVVSWIPDPADSVPGFAQVIDLASGRPVWQFSIGYHPDCVMFTPDGRYLLAANECEPRATDRVGGLTVADLSGIQAASDFVGYNEAVTYKLTDEHLGPDVDLGVLRVAPGFEQEPGVNIEPEYIAATNDGAWVSLQENNGIGYFDLVQRRWTRVLPLGMLSFAFDGSETDGPTLTSGDGFGLLSMPDTIAAYERDGVGYVVMANEGEKSDEHSMRLRDAIGAGLVDAKAIERVERAVGDLEASGYSRLYISTIDGDLDGDGDLDVLCPLGGRSVSIMDAQSGRVVWNSGPQIELVSGKLFPERYNAGDSRSDRAGPEPEGVAVTTINGRTLMSLGLERVDAVMLYDITNPYAPALLDVRALSEGCQSPEGLHFFSFDDRHFLAVAGEIGGCLTIYEIAPPAHEKPTPDGVGSESR